MLNKDGVASLELVKSRFPDGDYLVKPLAITECYEDIPCNPCSTSCPFDAIYIGKDINTQPKVDFDKCTGCGICVYNCPGLAIVVVKVIDNKIAQFKIPYEQLPYPVAGEVWSAVNREGKVIGQCNIEKVSLSKRQDKTALVQLNVNKKYLYEFVTIKEKL
ncbi:MAG: 4Fe-4S binding protein [Candidatus Izemoplasma sp.]